MLSEEYGKAADALIDICVEKGFSDDAIMSIGAICCSEDMEEALGSIEAGLTCVSEYAKTAKTAEDVIFYAYRLSNGEIQ